LGPSTTLRSKKIPKTSPVEALAIRRSRTTTPAAIPVDLLPPGEFMKDLISHQLMKYLEARGVEHVFGMCGHTNIAVLAAMEKSRIRFINVRHEQIAAHMADGYARAGKRTGVVLSHIGPGFTNASTGVANAALDSIPMVVIAGDIPTHYYGKNAFQEINRHADASQFEIYRPFVKRAWRVERPDLFPEIIDKAFALAEDGCPGPVLVDVPMDIFSEEIDVALFDRVRNNVKTVRRPTIEYGTAAEIVKQLAGAKRPLLYVGGGIMLADASAELREFVDHLQIPVAHTLMGKGALADDHPFVLGVTGFWGTRFTNEQCKAADWILALGTRFGETDCSSWESQYTFNFPTTKLIHIDIEGAEIGRNYPVEIGAIADLKQALLALTRAARKLLPEGMRRSAVGSQIAAARAAFVESNRTGRESNAYPMRPERILADVRAALPRDALITTDVGWNKNGVVQQFPIFEPGTIFTPGGYATMGFSGPAALGAKLAQPDRVVVSLVGDGGFGQNPSLLATAFEQGIGVVWVIMNNYGYGTIAGLEKAHFGTTYGTLFEKDGTPYSPDYAAIAKAYRIDGIRIESAAELRPALERAIRSGKPTVIEVDMVNEPVPTSGHWNIMDIYSPGKNVHHVPTGATVDA
jgi:acetolactate synthase-1/2/3 large subunit